MTILDSNGLIYFLRNGKVLPDSELTTTEDLRDEYDTALLVNGRRTLRTKDISELSGYDEAYYYKEYVKYLNSFSGVNVASMRSLTDASILALVSCVTSGFGRGGQTSLEFGDEYIERVIVISKDDDLIKRLIDDFGSDVEIIDPVSL